MNFEDIFTKTLNLFSTWGIWEAWCNWCVRITMLVAGREYKLGKDLELNILQLVS